MESKKNLDVREDIVTKAKEKAKVLSAAFTSVVNSKISSCLSVQPLERDSRYGEQSKAPRTQEEIISDLLHHLDTQKSMGPDGNHLRVLRELAEMLTKTHSIVYQQSYLNREVPADWRLENVMSIYMRAKRRICIVA